MKKFFWNNWRLYAVLTITFFIGFGLVYVSGQYLLRDIFKEIGVAFMIAAVLGATVDIFLQISLIRDVFSAAFQYVMHPALKEEIGRILHYRLFADKHEWLVAIERISDRGDLVRVSHELHRRIRNYGSTAEKIKVYLHIDEWGFKEPCKIIYCRAKLDEGTITEATQQDTDDLSVLFSAEDVKIKPNQSIEVTAKWTETKRANDSTYLNLTYPTIDPQIEVRAPPDFGVSRSFGSASENITETIPGRQTVAGTYMPYQFMLIRWWPRDHNRRQTTRSRRKRMR